MAKGIVVICSACLAVTYFGAAYGLRRVAFPRLKDVFENFAAYQVIANAKIPVMDWIDQVKLSFYFCLGYFAIGFAGLLGAVLEVQLFLWPNVREVTTVLKSILEYEDDVREVCNVAGAILGFSCDSFFDKVENHTIGAGVAVGLLMLTTLICTLLLIRSIHRETGSYLFTFCGASCGGSKSDIDRDDDSDHELGKGWEAQRRRGRVRRGAAGRARRTASSSEGEEAIELLALGSRERELERRMPSAVFDLPRMQDRSRW
ncbi:hypothetical protein JCM10212_004953 [Sporobolomyces blumeae]